MKKILAVNPHFYDFSAFDFWAKPLGFLYLLAILKNLGFEVDFIDCLDRRHPALKNLSGKFKKTHLYGTGHYYFQKVKKPAVLASVPLQYKRYGLPEEIFRAELVKKDKPDLILVTSLMTYWYQGVAEAIKILKEIFPGVPVILGGTYPTLLPDHSRSCSGADLIFGAGERGNFFDYLRENFGPFGGKVPADFSEFPGPDFSFYQEPAYGVLKTSAGCPFDCSYCAVKKISPHFSKKPLSAVIDEIELFQQQGFQNLAFYDDALLYLPDYFENLLREIQKRKIKMFFHTSNGLHARFVTAKMAKLMKKNNFIWPRLSLETINPARQKETGGKVNCAEFEKAVFYLKEAGYQAGEIGVYLLCGLPDQSFEEVKDSINYAARLGLKITLAEFSPVPGTPDFEKSGLKDKDPLWHNNSIFPLHPLADWPKFQQLKDLVKAVNRGYLKE